MAGVRDQRTRTTNPAATGAIKTSSGPDLTTVREIADLKLSMQDIHSKRINNVRLRTTEQFCLPPYFGDSDPTDHVTVFNIAMGRANFLDNEKDTYFCQLFVESLAILALTWFS